MTQKPEHYPHNFIIGSNRLQLNNNDIISIATAHKQPFYAYDSQAIKHRIRELKNSLPQRVHIHYAIKANPMPELLELMATQVNGFDVASGGELALALDTGMSARNISFAGPGKTLTELEQAINAGITLNIESITELQRIVQIGQNLSLRPSIAIRVNPDFELKSAGMKMTGGSKPFGIDAEQLPDILRDMDQLNVHFCGFHIFSGSQNLRTEAIIEAQAATFKLAVELSSFCSKPIERLNIGGGFGIPYFPGDKPIHLQQIADSLDMLLMQYQETFAETEIILELGRYLVGEAGIYVCQITDKKVSRGKTYLITNGGLHHHLAASGNFGQVIRKNYPLLVANRVHSDQLETVSVVGPLCTPLDVLAENIKLPKAEIGDYIAVLQSGAYGYTASPHCFLSHPKPQEILL